MEELALLGNIQSEVNFYRNFTKRSGCGMHLLPCTQIVWRDFRRLRNEQRSLLRIVGSSRNVVEEIEDHLHRHPAMLSINNPQDMFLREKHFEARCDLFFCKQPSATNTIAARTARPNVCNQRLQRE